MNPTPVQNAAKAGNLRRKQPKPTPPATVLSSTARWNGFVARRPIARARPAASARRVSVERARCAPRCVYTRGTLTRARSHGSTAAAASRHPSTSAGPSSGPHEINQYSVGTRRCRVAGSRAARPTSGRASYRRGTGLIGHRGPPRPVRMPLEGAQIGDSARQGPENIHRPQWCFRSPATRFPVWSTPRYSSGTIPGWGCAPGGVLDMWRRRGGI